VQFLQNEGFGAYARDSNLTNFTLFELKAPKRLLVLTSEQWGGSCTLGPEWDAFCRLNELEEGDTIIF